MVIVLLKWRPVLFVIALLPAMLIASRIWAAEPVATDKSAATKPKPKITVSKETTYVLGPLRNDGTVDFVAALNEMCSKGVTPENNAAVPFWQAVGPSAIPEKDRAQFFKLLGVAPPADEGSYFISMWKFASEHRGDKRLLSKEAEDAARDKLYSQQEQTADHPWSKKEFPLFADYLDAIEKPLNLVIEGTRRPNFYSPICPDTKSKGLNAAINTNLYQAGRETAQNLQMRAMLRLQAGRIDDAFQDALACHRLARHIGQGPFVINLLVGIAIDNIASTTDLRIAEYAQISAEQAKKYRSELEILRPLNIAETIGVGERLYALDAVCRMSGDAPVLIRSISNPGFEPTPRGVAIAELAATHDIDWDLVLRRINAWYDRMTQALAKPNFAERNQAVIVLDKVMALLLKQPAAAKKGDQTQPPGEVSVQIAEFLAAAFSPGLVAESHAEGRFAARLELAMMSYAFAAYRTEHDGRYPAKLADLVPKYIAAVPADPFTGGPLHYKLDGKGYLLYSVGPNGQDDGGRDLDADPPGDDVAVRMPHKVK